MRWLWCSPWRHVRRRVHIYWSLSDVPRPFVRYVDEGPEWHYLAVGLGSLHGDAIVTLEVFFGEDM